MAEFIKPVSVCQVRSSHGYTIRLTKKNRLNQVEAELSLEPVLELSWSQADKLEKFFVEFLKDQSEIMLNNEAQLKQHLHRAVLKKAQAQKSLEDSEAEIAEIISALEERKQ